MRILAVVLGLLIGILIVQLAKAGDCFGLPSQDYWHGCLGDVDADGDVDELDLAFVEQRLGTAELAADVDLDGLVTEADLDLVAADIGANCAWPPAHHAVLRLVPDSAGADIWLDLPAGSEVAGIQAWLLTEPDRTGTVELDPASVWVDLCSGGDGSLFDGGRIGFAWGAAPGDPWVGSVHLGRIQGALGDYVLLYRLAAPPARCAELVPCCGVRGLRFTVVVEPQRPAGKHGISGLLPR